MDFSINKEQDFFRQETIRFARENLNTPDTLEDFSEKMWKKVSDYGLLGITVGEQFGGLNESYTTAAIVFEALGYSCKNNGLIFVINNHIWVSQNLIYLYGSEELKEKYLSEMVKGNRIGAIAITEADSGSDALSLATTATEDNEFYVLNGSKMFISNGPIADIFVVFARTSINSISAFVVEKQFDGFKVCPNIQKMGLGGCPTSEIIFNNCRVPKENILGNINQGAFLLNLALEWERCFEFVPHIGVMQRIMEECTEHVNSRMQFDKYLSEYQAVTHKISDMKIAIEMARMMLYKITWLKDHGKTAYVETSIFKVFVSENYIKTCRDAIQIFGAYGYTKEYDYERELRDALASSIYSGTNEMQRNTIFNMLNF